jgi:hypothetical protein
MGNYVSIKEILERSDYDLVINMINTEMSTKIYQELYKTSYNNLLRVENVSEENNIYQQLGLKRPKNQQEFNFNRIIQFSFLEEISSLKCYEIFLKDIFQKNKNDPEQVYEIVTKKIKRNMQSFDYINFIRYFFTFGNLRCIKEFTYKKICEIMLNEMNTRPKEPFFLYLYCSVLLALMKFNFNVFKNEFLDNFVDKVFLIFKVTKDQKFIALLSDIIYFVKSRQIGEKSSDFFKLAQKVSKIIIDFFNDFTKREKFLKNNYKNSEFLIRYVVSDKAKGTLSN